MQRRNPRRVRKRVAPSCRVCGLMLSTCVCDLLPRIRSRVELVVYQHFSELNRQSNTGRLVAHMIEPSRILQWGSETPIPETTFDEPDAVTYVLFPRSTMNVLSAEHVATDGRRTSLILLDATWGQARSMSRRIPAIQSLPFLSLPEGDTPTWKLRRSPGSGQCCTLEAAYRAVSILDGESVAAPLMTALELIMARGLHQRGKIRRAEMEATCEPLLATLAQAKAAAEPA